MIRLNKSLREHSSGDDPTNNNNNVELRRQPQQEQSLRPTKNNLQEIELSERRYQRELCLRALEENVIIYLGTGLGKTFITVLYLREVYHKIRNGQHVVFLAPTQDLTRQQAEYFKKHLQVYRQNVYSGRSIKGSLHIDRWQRDTWESELGRYDILFMTPQIFANALQHNLVDWESFAAIIFDECHHAARKKGVLNSHPYSSILKHYEGYYKYKSGSAERPRIIGLTASLINNQPKKRTDIDMELGWLEKDLCARCVTDFVVQDKRPGIIIQGFATSGVDESTHTLFSFFHRANERLELATEVRSILKLKGRPQSTLSSQDERLQRYSKLLSAATIGFSIKPSKFPKIFKALAEILKRCGLWQFHRMCVRIVEALDRPINSSCDMPQTRAIYCSLKQLLTKTVDETSRVLHTYPNFGLEQCRSKLYSLLDVLEVEYKRMLNNPGEKETFSCVVFVKSRLEVVAVQSWLHEVSEKLDRYNFIKSEYAVGLAASASSTYAFLTKTTPKAQTDKLNRFRNSKLNVIVTTSVLEEGIDLPVCSTVIRYDLPWNFREFVQSRGRARQEKSSFIVLSEYSKLKEDETRLHAYYDFELTVQDALKKRDIGAVTRESSSHIRGGPSRPRGVDEDVFILREGQIRIDGTAAKILLHMYCNYITKKRLFAEGATYGRDYPTPNTCQTTLYLPSACPIVGGVKGAIRNSTEAADNSACVAAIKALYEAKELDENAIPFRLNEKSIDQSMKEAGFNCDMEPLDKELEGIREVTGDKEVHYFPTRMAFLRPSARGESVQIRYKMIGLNFVSNKPNNREDAKCFLEMPKYGLIVEASVSEEFLPDRVWGHYGEYRIDHKIIIDSFQFSNADMPTKMMRYMHRLLSYCIGLRNLNFLDLQQVCPFFIVPLHGDNLDIRKLQNSFGWPRNQSIREGDIVKVRLPVDNMLNRGKDSNRFLFVKSYRPDLKPTSKVPGLRKTFIEHVQLNYPRERVRTDQRIFEVVPISRQVASLDIGKSTSREETTSSLFYLEEFLEHFDSDPAGVFQAFNLPEIIYKLYSNLEAADFDGNFTYATEARRNLTKNTEQANSSILYDPAHGESVEPVETIDVEGPENASDDDADDVVDDDDDEIAALSDGDNIELSDSEDSLADSDDHNQYGTIDDVLSREDRSHFKKWDIDEYISTLGVNELRKVEVENRYPSARDEPDIYEESAHFVLLEQQLRSLLDDLIDKLENLKKESADGRLENEDESFTITTQVEAKEPPFTLDRRQVPFRVASRQAAVLEALTQRRAGQSYNLESLETIGDSYLKYTSSVALFKRTDVKEGMLTVIRSRLTCNKYFTYLAKKNRLGCYAVTRGFSPELLGHILGARDRNNRVDKRHLNRMRPKDLADIFESLVGAYLIYQGEFDAILLMEWMGLKMFDEKTFDEIHEGAVVFSRVESPLFEEPSYGEFFKRSQGRVTQFETIIGYQFNDKAFAVQAFTHSSALSRCTESYERLEFLGDAILDFLVVLTLYSSGSVSSPGQLTSSKSALVNNYIFAKMALKYKFHQFIDHANVDLHIELNRIQDELEEDPSMSFLNMVDYDSIVKLLADTFESVAAAIYLDSGCSLDAVWRVYYSILKDSIDSEIAQPTKNQIAVLYETFVGGILFEDFIDPQAEDMKCVRLIVTGYGEFEGRGLSKKQAKLRAVQECLRNPVTAGFIDERKKRYAPVVRAPRQQQRPPGRGGYRHNSQQRQRSCSRQSSGSRR